MIIAIIRIQITIITMITIKEEKLFEELDEETQQIIDACIENGFNKLETAFAVACYQEFDFTLEEVMEMVERNVIISKTI